VCASLESSDSCQNVRGDGNQQSRLDDHNHSSNEIHHVAAGKPINGFSLRRVCVIIGYDVLKAAIVARFSGLYTAVAIIDVLTPNCMLQTPSHCLGFGRQCLPIDILVVCPAVCPSVTHRFLSKNSNYAKDLH